MNKLNVAMIGCGRISEMYKEVFKKLKNEVRVVFAVDTKIEKAQKFAAEFKGCTATPNYKDCFKQKIDIMHIATPHYLHHNIAIDAMQHKINVLTEKPMSIYLQDADKMINIAKKENVKLGVIFQTRYVKGCMDIKKLINKGNLGKILAARSYLSWNRSDNYYTESDWKGTWDKEGGGVLIDQAIHSIDRVQWLVGDKVDWIEATIKNRGHKAVDVEDIAEAFVKFKNGCLYQLYACNCYHYDAPIEIEIVGEKGKVGLKQDLAWVHLNGENYYEITDGYDGLSVGPNYWGCSHITQLKDFYKSVRENSCVTVDGNEGKNALEIIRGIYHSAILNKKIYLPFEDYGENLIKNNIL